MERLVIPNKAGSLCYNDTDQGLKLEPNEITSHQRWLLLERLHEYEDTGLTPGQIREMQKLLSRENTPETARSSQDSDGWIPVEERLPEDPKETPVFDNKPLELYLVDMGGSYPLRAFWNGKQFTDGWSILKVIAWRPLPDPYRPERSNDEKE